MRCPAEAAPRFNALQIRLHAGNCCVQVGGETIRKNEGIIALNMSGEPLGTQCMGALGQLSTGRPGRAGA